jgi:hypothetical protein
VKGDVGTRAKPKYERWYAKITGFVLDDGLSEPETDEINISHFEEARATVVWFHQAKDPLSVLPKSIKAKDLTMLKHAFDPRLYILGKDPQEIDIETIEGRQQGPLLLAFADRSARCCPSGKHIRLMPVHSNEGSPLVPMGLLATQKPSEGGTCTFHISS